MAKSQSNSVGQFGVQGIWSGRKKLTGTHRGKKHRVRETLGSTALGKMWLWAKAAWKELGNTAWRGMRRKHLGPWQSSYKSRKKPTAACLTKWLWTRKERQDDKSVSIPPEIAPAVDTKLCKELLHLHKWQEICVADQRVSTLPSQACTDEVGNTGCSFWSFTFGLLFKYVDILSKLPLFKSSLRKQLISTSYW